VPNSRLAHRSSITLSANGLPTDISLEITGAVLGYLPSVHFVLDVDETLGYGKRNLPPRSKGLYNQLAKDLWRNIWKIAEKVVKEEEERDWTLSGNLFDPRAEASAIVDPASAEGKALQELLGWTTLPKTEEDVVASYFYMAGRGLVPRYGFVRLNDNTVYDAITTAVAPAAIPRPEELLTVEFKPSTLELCQSDEMGRQRFQDMQLGIVWEVTEQTALPPDYACVAKEGDIGFTGYLPGANYRLKHGRHSVQIIALKDIFRDASPTVSNNGQPTRPT
jgi:hypothetical protein